MPAHVISVYTAWRTNMLLRYQNLTIRDAVVQDAGQLAQWWNDGRVMAHAGFPNGTGETVQDIAIGEMSVRWKADATAAIGIKLCDASRQNKGIGKVLLSMLISSLFHEQGCHRIILYVNLTNTRAQHVYEQLGFTRVRVNENSWTDQLGRQQSSVDYVLYQKDFISYLNG